jgi:hypothetical protein
MANSQPQLLRDLHRQTEEIRTHLTQLSLHVIQLFITCDAVNKEGLPR